LALKVYIQPINPVHPWQVSVDLVTYNALISAMSPARQWLRALALLALAASATAPALRPNAVTYNAAVAAMEPWRWSRGGWD